MSPPTWDAPGATWDAAGAQWDPSASALGPMLRTQTERERVILWTEAAVVRTTARPRLERTMELPGA